MREASVADIPREVADATTRPMKKSIWKMSRSMNLWKNVRVAFRRQGRKLDCRAYRIPVHFIHACSSLVGGECRSTLQ